MGQHLKRVSGSDLEQSKWSTSNTLAKGLGLSSCRSWPHPVRVFVRAGEAIYQVLCPRIFTWSFISFQPLMSLQKISSLSSLTAVIINSSYC